MEKHYDATVILIEYVSKMASKGDQKAVEVLRKFDKMRDYNE
jgi:hypothetical protein